MICRGRGSWEITRGWKSGEKWGPGGQIAQAEDPGWGQRSQERAFQATANWPWPEGLPAHWALSLPLEHSWAGQASGDPGLETLREGKQIPGQPSRSSTQGRGRDPVLHTLRGPSLGSIPPFPASAYSQPRIRVSWGLSPRLRLGCCTLVSPSGLTDGPLGQMPISRRTSVPYR